MKLKLSSNGTLAGTSLRDENGEPIKGIMGFSLTCDNVKDPRLTVSFIKVPFEISAELRRAGGNPVGTVQYLCGCNRNYFSETDAPKDGERCPFHGDAVRFSRVNVRAEELVQIGARCPAQ